MPATKQQQLTGWGNFPVAECATYRPEKQHEVGNIARQHGGSLIARGIGRSYADASLQPEGVLTTQRLDHVIAFDKQTGLLTAQAGMTLADIMAMAIPEGWFPPVIPGTRYVTLGGAVACNVHGKNHFREGDLAEHVKRITLTLADGSRATCGPEEQSDLFWATAGGMGMTGIIEEVTLQLKRIESSSLKHHIYCVDTIEEMMAGFAAHRDSADYMIGWIDHMAKGDNLGRGLFSAASHIGPHEGGQTLATFKPQKTKLYVPIFFPGFVLNRYSMALYNRYRFGQYSKTPKDEIVGFDGFFHPLDSIGNWNKLYGRRGFFQYQCMIPECANVTAHVREFLALLQEKNLFSFLGVIKYHRQGVGQMTFPIAGYSLALDFPNTARVRELLPSLDAWVANHGGRIYLAKDGLLSPEHFYAMYSNAPAWKALLERFDPKAKFTSLMSNRLQWKTYSPS